jgi:hypothetical protein
VLAPWSALWAGIHAHSAGQSWHFFAEGGRLLFSGGAAGGLHVYATHPVLQMGPLALAVSAVLNMLGTGTGRVVALVAMSATGLPLLAAVWRLVPAPERLRRGRLLTGGLVFLPVWTELTTHFGHLDDVLALSLSVAAVHAVSRRHPVWAGLALAAAADAKPWAAAFVVLLLALPRRDRWPALGAFVTGVAVAWLPFVAADPHTLMAARFVIPNDYSSALRVIGVNSAGTPWWDRSAQLALGLAGGYLAVRRGRWPAVILIVLAVRILLDPGVYAYYTSGVLLGTLMVDLLISRWRLPWTTAVAAALLYAARFTHVLFPFTLHELGLLRTLFAIGVPVLVLGLPARWLGRGPGRHARAASPRTLIRGYTGRPLDARPLDDRPLDDRPLDDRPQDWFQPLNARPQDWFQPLDDRPPDWFRPQDGEALDFQPLDFGPYESEPPVSGGRHPLAWAGAGPSGPGPQ